MLYDFHFHSHYSDGVDTPTTIVKKAKRKNMIALSLADHDSIDGIAEFERACKKAGIISVPGIEISANYKNRSIHILGYGFDPTDKIIRYICAVQHVARREHAQRVAKYLANLGFEITFEDFDKQAQKSVITLPHMARALAASQKNRKLMKDTYHITQFDYQTVISKVIEKAMNKPGRPDHVSSRGIGAKMALYLLKKAGATTILAHPEVKFSKKAEFEKAVTDLRKSGLDGIEAGVTSTPKSRIHYNLVFARKKKLLTTISSDDHDGDTVGVAKVDKEQVHEIYKQFLTRVL